MTAARILDRRYQTYSGPRRGEAYATYRLAIHSFQRLVGLRRPAKFKIVPVLLGIGCLIIPLAFIAVAALIPGVSVRLEFGSLYRLLGIPITLFVFLVGPGGLIADRITKSLSLYLASPLTRTTYLIGQAAALFAALAVVTLGPGLLYLVGVVAQGTGPDGVIGVLSLAGKIILAGSFLSLYFTALTMAAGAFSNRPAIAAGAIFLSTSVLDLMGTVAARRFESDLPLLLSIGELPSQIVDRIFNHSVVEGAAAGFEFGLGTPAAVIAGLTWMAIGFAATWLRYQRMVVSR